MASRTARHEEYSSSNVVRSLNPSRPLSPPQKNIEYNNNNLGESFYNYIVTPIKLLFGFIFNYFLLFFFPDNLLDDLQTTVTRTAQHLDSANASKSRDVQFLKPSNTTTIAEERTSSPGGVSNRIYVQVLNSHASISCKSIQIIIQTLSRYLCRILFKVHSSFFDFLIYSFVEFRISLCINFGKIASL